VVQVTLAGARDGGTACQEKACNPYTLQPDTHKGHDALKGDILLLAPVRAQLSSKMTESLTM